LSEPLRTYAAPLLYLCQKLMLRDSSPVPSPHRSIHSTTRCPPLVSPIPPYPAGSASVMKFSKPPIFFWLIAGCFPPLLNPPISENPHSTVLAVVTLDYESLLEPLFPPGFCRSFFPRTLRFFLKGARFQARFDGSLRISPHPYDFLTFSKPIISGFPVVTRMPPSALPLFFRPSPMAFTVRLPNTSYKTFNTDPERSRPVPQKGGFYPVHWKRYGPSCLLTSFLYSLKNSSAFFLSY